MAAKKAKKEFIDIVLILDRSGSMSSIRDDMEGAMTEFFKEQKNLKGDVRASLYQFDTDYQPVFEGVPIKDVPPVRLEPRGSTALLDAIGKTINALDTKQVKEKPAKTIVCIVTDGQENSSREYTHETVKALISKHSEWQFMYLGANQDAITVARDIGINPQNAMSYMAGGVGSHHMGKVLGSTVSSYARGATQSLSVSEEDRKTANDILSGKIK